MRWLVVTLLALLVTAPSARAADDFIFNGDVRTILHAPDGSTYIGGDFTAQLRPTGGGLIAATTGSGFPDQADVPFPPVHGSVYAAVRDGNNGWFVGGNFRRVGAYEIHNLVHITNVGAVDPAWRPDPDGEVRALTRSGTTVYAGGAFEFIGDKPRLHAAAIDAATAAIGPFVADTDGDVRAITISGSTVFLGGAFTVVNRLSARNGLAAVNASTGAVVDGFDPRPDGQVNALAVRNQTLYVGGSFANVAGQPRRNFAAVDTASGALTDFQYSATSIGGSTASVDALAISNATLFIGGRFNGPLSQNSLVALDLNNPGNLTPDFRPSMPSGSQVYALSVLGSTLYVGGNFPGTHFVDHANVLALDVQTGAASDLNPQPAGDVRAIAASGPRVYIGGTFLGAGPTVGKLVGLAKLRPDGTLDTGFHPDPGAVTGLAVHGSRLYVTGGFTGISGALRQGIAELSTTTGGVTSWNPLIEPDGTGIDTAVTFGGRFYVGGSFYALNGQSRQEIAAFDLDSGELTGFSPFLDGAAERFAPSSAGLFVMGAFDRASGYVRRQLAEFDPVTGAVAPWDPGLAANEYANGLAVAGSTVYIAGTFDHLGGKPRHDFGAVDTATGAATSFAPTLDGYGAQDVAVLDGTVYVTGDFTVVNGEPRRYMAAFDVATGALKRWDPQTDNVPLRLIVENGTLYAAGGFISAGGKVTGPFAALDTTPPDTTVGADGSFGSNEAGVSYECSVGGAFAPCTQAPDGAFAVRAVDFTGNVDPTPATFTPAPPAPEPIVIAPAATPAPLATPAPTPTRIAPKKPSKLVTITYSGAYKIGKISRSRGCRGALTLELRHGRTLLQSRSGKLDSRCRYKTTFSVARTKVGSAKQLTVVVRFRGNKYLAATSDRFPVRVPA